MSPTGMPICVHPDNPHYFLYNNRPLVLCTASEHYGAVSNRNFDFRRYLDETADKKLNLSRCFLLFRSTAPEWKDPPSSLKCPAAAFVAPYIRSGPGYATDGYPKYDLDQWNPEYFERLHAFLAESTHHGVIVELTLFCWAYSDHVWDAQPFNVKNNINGVGAIDWRHFTTARDASLFERQRAFVRKIVNEVNAYDNVYFEVCAEPMSGFSGQPTCEEVDAWQAEIRSVIRSEEARLPKRHLIFQMPTWTLRRGKDVGVPLNEPTIDAVNVHQGENMICYKNLTYPIGQWQAMDLKLREIHYLWNVCHEVPKPLVNDGDHVASAFLNDICWTIQRKRAWTTICSGGHYNMIDYSIEGGGQENGSPEARTKIRTWLKHLSAFIHAVDFVHMVPMRDFCWALPRSTIAATLANPAREYVIYVADDREVNEAGQGEPCSGILSFCLPIANYEIRFFDPVSGQYSLEVIRSGGGDVSLSLGPFIHDIVLHVTAIST